MSLDPLPSTLDDRAAWFVNVFTRLAVSLTPLPAEAFKTLPAERSFCADLAVLMAFATRTSAAPAAIAHGTHQRACAPGRVSLAERCGAYAAWAGPAATSSKPSSAMIGRERRTSM